MYNRDGSLFAEGIFTLGGLLAGKMYYPNGQVKFIGTCNDKNFLGKGDYYGPTYPIEGQFFLETGELLHEGDFRITRGGVGYPTVIHPEGFGSITPDLKKGLHLQPFP